VATQAVDAAVGALVLVVALPLLGVRPSPALAWLPVLALLLGCLTVGLVLLLSCANVFFRDARHLVQLLLNVGVFLTPVFFDAAMFGPRGARLLMLNLLQAAAGWSPWYLAYAAVWAVGALVVGAVVFHRAERLFAEYV
jgi:ABC-type polysaccharide/polyol phosphate export permease